jgi:5-formyltetrahydrofolate cyclo-ligase
VPRIDLIVAGSVAVGRDGARVGKGGGFSDLEFALLSELRLVGRWTTVVSTVHPLQIVREPIPMLVHDIPLDVIVTPDEVIRCPRRHPRPRGIAWASLSADKIAEVPLLARLAREEGPERPRVSAGPAAPRPRSRARSPRPATTRPRRAR